MGFALVCVLTAVVALRVIGAARVVCPNDPNCVCGGTLAIELNCNIDGKTVKINMLPNTFMNIKCENTTKLDYSKLPKCANNNMYKSVSFKDCPLPTTSFMDVLTNIGVSRTMALIFQNAKNLSGYFDRKHFAGLQDLTKLLLSVNGIARLPDDVFEDINNLTWLNIRSNSINLSEKLFKPLERLETLEISHNHMTNISSSLFSHLSFLRKLSLWQSNVTWFSKDFFNGVDVLEELDLSSNGLDELPASIFKPLRKLKKLTLFSNKFASLPQTLFKSNDELETVIILNNDVQLQLPRHLLGRLTNLKQVYIQRCGLREVPYDVFANSPSITNMSLSYNDIQNLSESTFNDQINLLELDLSHNKLEKLEPKIFSSLVRLEKLNLCYNSLVEVSGSTFSSLLSLIYLNMEHNNLKTISSYLFSNNKQRMSISLAYNYLDFETKELINNSWVVKTDSPFSQTYNLRLLNLSHNDFKVSQADWWINGHDILDISHNSIKRLWDFGSDNDLKENYKKLVRKSLIEVWVSGNPLGCKCYNFMFLEYLHKTLKTKTPDIDTMKCPILSKEVCYLGFTITISILTIFSVLSVVIILLLAIYRKQIHSLLKNKLYALVHQQESSCNDFYIKVTYAEADEEFILKELLPNLDNHKNIKILMNPTANNNENRRSNHLNTKNVNTTLVLFSPNYLMSAYSHVNIKRIRGEMMKAKNTIYVFADIGPENSVYTFLKDQSDPKTTVMWSAPDFWNIFLSRLYKKYSKVRRCGDLRCNTKLFDSGETKLSNSSVPDWPDLYTVDPYSHSQV